MVTANSAVNSCQRILDTYSFDCLNVTRLTEVSLIVIMNIMKFIIGISGSEADGDPNAVPGIGNETVSRVEEISDLLTYSREVLKTDSENLSSEKT